MSYAYILVLLDLAPLCIQLSCEEAHFGMENGICVFPKWFSSVHPVLLHSLYE